MENPNIRQTDIAGDKLKYFPIFFYERVTKTIMAEQILPKHEEMKNAPQLLDLSSYLTLPDFTVANFEIMVYCKKV